MEQSIIQFFSTPKASTLSSVSNFVTTSSGAIKRKKPPFPRGQNQKRRCNQPILNFGQKKIGLEHCSKCGMVYNVDDQNDVKQHENFHNRFNQEKYFRVMISQINSWKENLYNEEIELPFPGYIFRVNKSSSSTLKKKFEDVLQNFVNVELGYSEFLSTWGFEKPREALIFVRNMDGGFPPYIGGIVLIELIGQAILMPQKKIYKGEFLGVERIWVHAKLRRYGVATMLLDSARRILVNGGTLPRSRMAFGDPTKDGINLAIGFVGDKENGRHIIYSSESNDSHIKGKLK